MDTFILVLTWLLGIGSGGLLCVGIIRLATGQPAIKLSRSPWSVSENRALGACATIQGVALAAYGLIGGLTLGSHSIPMFGVGHWWGLFSSIPFAVLMFVTVYVQTYLHLRHEIRRHVVPM